MHSAARSAFHGHSHRPGRMSAGRSKRRRSRWWAACCASGDAEQRRSTGVLRWQRRDPAGHCQAEQRPSGCALPAGSSRCSTRAVTVDCGRALACQRVLSAAAGAGSDPQTHSPWPITRLVVPLVLRWDYPCTLRPAFRPLLAAQRCQLHRRKEAVRFPIGPVKAKRCECPCDCSIP